MVWKKILDVSKFALFDVLLDRVKNLLGGYFHFCVAPTRYFYNHVVIVAIPENATNNY